MKMRTLVVLLCSIVALASAMDAPKCTSADHTQWLVSSLREMETIHVGMTRQDFLKVFKPQTGFFSSTRFKGVYAYRDSPYIKVDVEFASPEGAPVTGPETPQDVIKSISRPYLGEVAYD